MSRDFRKIGDRLPTASFTLIELLTVMAIILILAALSLAAGSALFARSARSRAASELQGIGSALDGYKADNGIYPTADVATGFVMSGTLLTNAANDIYFAKEEDGTSTDYQKTSQVLFLCLTGQTNFADSAVSGPKVYISFRANQISDPSGAATGASYIHDPWNYSYGYSIGTTNGAPSPSYPLNGQNQCDLWTTGGLLSSKITATPSLTNAWLANWK